MRDSAPTQLAASRADVTRRKEGNSPTQATTTYIASKSVLTTEGALAVLQAAMAKATEQGTPMTIAVVDDAGALKAFVRMDGANNGSIQYPRRLTHPTDIHNYAELMFGLFDLFPHITPYRPGTPSYDQLYRHQHLASVVDAAL
jgi:Haem-degrading